MQHKPEAYKHSQTEAIRRKQKHLIALRTLSLGLMVLIPLSINFLNRVSFKPWQITAAVSIIGAILLVSYRLQQKFRTEIARACHQLGPGVKLRRKFKNDPDSGNYQIFQEGHRYYYLQHSKTGEKRLVAKEKILQDFDIAL